MKVHHLLILLGVAFIFLFYVLAFGLRRQPSPKPSDLWTIKSPTGEIWQHVPEHDIYYYAACVGFYNNSIRVCGYTMEREK